jgi:hypothetical protein
MNASEDLDTDDFDKLRFCYKLHGRFHAALPEGGLSDKAIKSTIYVLVSKGWTGIQVEVCETGRTTFGVRLGAFEWFADIRKARKS